MFDFNLMVMMIRNLTDSQQLILTNLPTLHGYHLIVSTCLPVQKVGEEVVDELAKLYFITDLR